jgi:tetratricopeptide (TPR) repeat protein
MFLCVFFTTKAQTGIELFQQENFEEASLVFEYEYFVSGLDSSLLYKAYSQKALGDYENAIRTLNRIRSLDIGYEKALLHYLNGNYEQSRSIILRQRMFDDNFNSDLVILEILNEMARNDYSRARDLLIENQGLLGLNEVEMDDILDRRLKKKDPERAYNISLFLPGIGQWYAGYFGKGFLSGFIQTGLVGFSAYSLYTGYFFSGTLTGVAMFYTFYLGGARYARELAIQKNTEVSTKIRNEFIKTINEKSPD